MLEAALTYAQAGLRVHPCRPADKKPYTRWGTAATTDEEAIRAFWKRWPDALIAVCTGSGLVVVDDDRGLAEPDPELAGTLTCRTRSRGYHHWFWTREVVGNGVGVLPGIDIRGDGGYVIAPPSPGWEWVDDKAGISPLPFYVREAMQEGRWTAAQPMRLGRGFEPLERVAEGGRNDYIARFAGWAIRQGWEEDLLDLCIEHNAQVCVPPLDIAEVKRTARSILARHRRSA